MDLHLVDMMIVHRKEMYYSTLDKTNGNFEGKVMYGRWRGKEVMTMYDPDYVEYESLLDHET